MPDNHHHHPAPDLLAALQECVTDDGAHCMESNIGHYTRIRRLTRRIEAINDTVRAALAKTEKGS